jgi:PAS domain S-box-containing protein
LGAVVVAHDETERRQTEQQLRFQAELLHSISDAVIATDLTLKIASWNKAAERVYGYEAKEVIGRDLREVVKQASPGGTVAIDLADTANSWQPEQVHYRKDGTMLQILSSISLMRDSYEQPTGLVIVNHDITALKHTEGELERRLEQLALLRHIDAELGHTLDIEKVLTFSLRAAAAVAGADSGFIALIDQRGEPQIEVCGDAVLPVTGTNVEEHAVVTYLNSTLESLHFTEVNDLLPFRNSLQPETKALIALPLLNQQRFIGLIELETKWGENFTDDVFEFLNILVQRIATSVDNARLYRLSQNHLAELQALYAQVSKLEQVKTDMIRIASHDLRSPIGLISGYLALLENDLSGRIESQEAEFLAEAIRATNRMEQLTRDLLSLERISQVADSNFEETVDLIAVVERSVEAFRQQAAHAKQKLVYAVDRTMDEAFVKGDPAQLYEAMSNLLSNALKYTPEDGEITVVLKQSENAAVFTVTDTGYGIPDSEHDKLFQPFSRVGSIETAGMRGSGLGLHLVKNIIDRHDGRVFFRSEYQKGSTFGFELPLVEQTAAEVSS